MQSRGGRYRIQAVSKLTGVPAPTLRAWERRYGVPAPARTQSAYRLYDEDDVALVKQMRDLCDAGMAAAEAARTVLATVVEPIRPTPADPTSEACARIVDATVRFDPPALEAAVSAALTLGSAASVYERVFSPAIVRIGDLWHRGEISVAQEHLASDVLETTLRNLLRLVQPRDAERLALLGCFEGEEHVLGLIGAGLRFTSWGFRTVDLGARTPASAIAHGVSHLKPDVVALSCVVPPPPAEARALVDSYADACRDVVWVVGGGGAEALRKRVEARGGLCVLGDLAQLRPQLDLALATRRRSRPGGTA